MKSRPDLKAPNLQAPDLKPPPRRIAAEDLAKMPNLGRCELVRGRVVAAHPSWPDHARVEANFCHELCSFVKPRGLGEVLVGEAGVFTGRDPDTVRGADVLFISSERFARRRAGFLDVAPELVVEVLSRSESRAQAAVEEKLSEYFSVGVQLVWVAEVATRTIRVHRSPAEHRTLGDGDVLSGEEILPGFEVPVSRVL